MKIKYRKPFFRKIDFLIIGAQKAGTTSLFDYLQLHPDCIGSKTKEVGFFSSPQNYRKGNNWYHNNFPTLGLSKNIFFEATPEYLPYLFTHSLIYRYNPNIKLILILRDPIARAFSAWNMYLDIFMNWKHGFLKRISNYAHPMAIKRIEDIYIHNDEFLPFREFIDYEIKNITNKAEELFPGLIKHSLYYEQLTNLLKYFKSEQILIIGTKDLRENKIETLRKVETFLNIKHINWPELKNKHIGVYSTQLPDDIKVRLNDFFKPHNQYLFNLLGRTLNW